MTETLTFVCDIEDPTGLHDLFAEYYADVLPRFAAIGGPVLDPIEMAADTLAKPEDLLPPRHRLLLAHSSDGALVGCGTLRRIRDDAGEMKRMFVRPVARGTGLGRRLFEARIEEARRMGLAWLFADTIRGNVSMLNLYEKFGFSYIDRYPENANPPEYATHLVFLSCKL